MFISVMINVKFV